LSHNKPISSFDTVALVDLCSKKSAMQQIVIALSAIVA